MSDDLFNMLWFIVFLTVILIALIANIIIILAILSDKSMHTSTYFYIINVNIADIILILSCLPERIAAVFRSNDGFHLGMFACYLVPFLQQVSMHAALGSLLILTVHRCYPAGVPRCLQRNLIRRQIRNYSRTLWCIWISAILINLPLFSITKYDKHMAVVLENHTNISYTIIIPTCDTEATEIWSRTYLILLLVLTYLITGIFLIVIYGQVIRIILTSNRYTNRIIEDKRNSEKRFHFLSPNNINQDRFREISARTSTSSSTDRSRQQHSSSTPSPLPRTIRISIEKPTSPTSSHSIQHLQVIIMLFVLIILYILLLLPYRLFNLLFIVYNQLFQHHEILFHWLLNIVRLLVFLNCALQPIIYLIISSRLRQTVMKFLQLCCYQYYFQCQCSVSYKVEDQAIQRHQNTNYQQRTVNYGGRRYLSSVNNIHMIGYQPLPLPRSPLVGMHLANKTPYTMTFMNSLRK